MVWSPYINSAGREAEKIWHLLPQYTRGIGLDIGCGPQTALPHMVGVDNGKAFGRGAAAIIAEPDALSLIAPDSLDFIFSSHMLEHIERKRVPAVLKCWASKLKVGGRLITYLPLEGHYPSVGEEGANPDHKWNVDQNDMEAFLREIGGWYQRECELRTKYDEYSIFEVYEKASSLVSHGVLSMPWVRNPSEKKRVLILRLGAFGDCLVAASPCAALRAEGFHVTMMTSAAGGEILENNPYIDELIVVDKEQFPPGQANIIAFTEKMKERYDRVVNMDRSLEGLCLAREDQPAFEYPHTARRYLMDHSNYYEVAHHICGAPIDIHTLPEPGFFPTADEYGWAHGGIKSLDGKGPIVVWHLAGSSFFKTYPAADIVIRRLLDDGINVVITGHGEATTALEAALIVTLAEDGCTAMKDHLYPRVGKWTLRKTCVFAMLANCVVGPETGLMHAVGFNSVPKVMMLSHSSPNNFGYYWKNATFIAPEPSECPCHPCHQIHTAVETCNYDEERHGARCTTAIDPAEVYEAIKRALANRSENPNS